MSKKKVMVVDDENLIVESIKEILENKGYNVITALSGPEALKKLKKSKVDLLLVDIMMPGMGGIELTRIIRKDKKLKNIKIAYITILAFSELQKYKFKKFKILDYIQKPFTSKELVRRVDKLIKKPKR